MEWTRDSLAFQGYTAPDEFRGPKFIDIIKADRWAEKKWAEYLEMLAQGEDLEDERCDSE